MDFTEGEDGGGGGGEAGGKVERFFIEGPSSSEGEDEIGGRRPNHRSGRKQASRLGGESSPPLLLAFSVTSGRAPSPSTDSQEEDGEQHIEDWMILGGGEQEGDSSIQLNLSYRSSCGGDSPDGDQSVNSAEDDWAVSEKDKCPADESLPSRYFLYGRSPTCHICNRIGHFAKTCYIKKCRTCILCGVRGHVQRDCPGRPCPSCGRPSHGLRPCEEPPVWNQHCQRCGVTGHLSDACPDTWRQYHLTIRLDIPIRPRGLKREQRLAQCYNCSEWGHDGYECTKRRMASGMFPSLPYVCHYDTMEDILQRRAGMWKRAKELVNAGSLLLSEKEHLSEQTGESGEDNRALQGRSRRNKEARYQPGWRKTWPEKRRERQEIKRQRREAQARREGGLLGRAGGHLEEDACATHPIGSPLDRHGQSTQPPRRKRKVEACGRGSKKSREMERWMKRRGIKRGDLYPYGDHDISSKNLVSPKQRVRHRRR